MLNAYGHAAERVRHMFGRAIEEFVHWDLRRDGPPPQVELEVNYEPHPNMLVEARRRVWGCTDILPGHLADMLVEYGLKTPTYAGAARVIKRHLA